MSVWTEYTQENDIMFKLYEYGELDRTKLMIYCRLNNFKQSST